MCRTMDTSGFHVSLRKYWMEKHRKSSHRVPSDIDRPPYIRIISRFEFFRATCDARSEAVR